MIGRPATALNDWRRRKFRGVPEGGAPDSFQMGSITWGSDPYDDLVAPIASSHHWMEVDGPLIKHTAPYRYTSRMSPGQR